MGGRAEAGHAGAQRPAQWAPFVVATWAPVWERGLVRDVPFEGVLEWEPDGEIKTSRDQCDTAPAAPFSDRSVGLEGDVFVPRRLRAALAGSERLGRAHRAAATRAPRARQGEGTVSADGPVRRGALGRSSAPRRASSGRLGPLRRTCSAPCALGLPQAEAAGAPHCTPLLGCGECAPSD